MVEREKPLRSAQTLLQRLRRRDLYKYVESAQVPVEVLRAGMCAANPTPCSLQLSCLPLQSHYGILLT